MKHKKIFLYLLLFLILIASLSLVRTCVPFCPFLASNTRCDMCQEVIPFPAVFTKGNNPPHFKAWSPAPVSSRRQLLGYVFLTSDLTPQISGFNGPFSLMIGTDTEGKILGLHLLSHAETAEYIRTLPSFLQQFIGMTMENSFQLGQDIDAISGATITSQAMTDAVRESIRIFNQKIIRQQMFPTTFVMGQEAAQPSPAPPISVQPQININVEQVKARLHKTGLVPREAKFWASSTEARGK